MQMRDILLLTVAVLTLLSVGANASLVNNPPIVDAGPDQTIFLGEVAYLNGTATDPDGDPCCAYEWEVISAASGSAYNLFDANTANATFATDTIGNYVITFAASDGLLWSVPDSNEEVVVISVILNLDPIASFTVSPDPSGDPLTVVFDASASYDPEGGSLLYSWDFGDLTFDCCDNSIVTHTFQDGGPHSVLLGVDDDFGNTAFSQISLSLPLPSTSVPEPAILALMGLGLAGIGFQRRRMARQ